MPERPQVARLPGAHDPSQQPIVGHCPSSGAGWGHDPVASGEILTYTLNVHNEGPDAADDVELHLRNAVMHGLVLTGASTSGGAPPSCSELADAKGYACRLGDLGAGETIVVTLEFEFGAESRRRRDLQHGSSGGSTPVIDDNCPAGPSRPFHKRGVWNRAKRLSFPC